MNTALGDGRPVQWPTDEEFFDVIASRTRAGDRLILLALRQHDLDQDNRDGAYPGHKRLAALTGLKPGYVRKRLSVMVEAGCLQSVLRGRLARYYIVPPVPSEENTSGVPPEENMFPHKGTHQTCSPQGSTRKGKVEESSNNNGQKLSPSLEEQLVLDHYKELHPLRRITDDKQIRVVRRALKLGFTTDELRNALTGNARDSWYREHKKQDLGYVLRDADQIGTFLSKYEYQEEPVGEEYFA